MAGETLLPSPVGRARTFPDLLELFAASMLRRTSPDEATRDIAARARSVARSQVTQARSPLGSQQMLALRAIYDEMRASGSVTALEATGESALPGRSRAARTFEAMLNLRHRQRAALVLHDVGALPTATVAAVLGVGHSQVHAIVEGARASIAARFKEPVNVRHALADVGRRLIAPLDDAEVAPAAPAPRAVVSALLAPPDDRPGTDALVSDPVALADAALRALEASPPDITLAPRPNQVVRRSVPTPILRPALQPKAPSRPIRALVAAACMVLLAVVVPAAARTPRLASSTPRVSATISTPVVAPASQARRVTPKLAPAPTTVTVRAGDTLWSIAEARLGDGNRWQLLWRLNARARMPGGRFTDPDLIRPGWRLRLPAA